MVQLVACAIFSNQTKRRSTQKLLPKKKEETIDFSLLHIQFMTDLGSIR